MTFGIYILFWYYRQFKRMKEKYGFDLSPFWRSFFAFFWVHGLFKSILIEAKEKNVGPGFNPGWVTAGYILITLLQNLPDPYWFVSVLCFIPILPVVRATNEIHRLERLGGGEGGFSGLEWAFAIAGSLLFLLAILGGLMPE